MRKFLWRGIILLLLFCSYSQTGFCEGIFKGSRNFRGEIVEQVCNLKGSGIFFFSVPVTSDGIYKKEINIELEHCSESLPKYMMFSSPSSNGEAIFQDDSIQLRMKKGNEYIRSDDFIQINNFNEFTIEIINLNKDSISFNRRVYITVEYVIVYA